VVDEGGCEGSGGRDGGGGCGGEIDFVLGFIVN
ncbi:unnamed protein product, partial [Rotaria socialis]